MDSIHLDTVNMTLVTPDYYMKGHIVVAGFGIVISTVGSIINLLLLALFVIEKSLVTSVHLISLNLIFSDAVFSINAVAGFAVYLYAYHHQMPFLETYHLSFCSIMTSIRYMTAAVSFYTTLFVAAERYLTIVKSRELSKRIVAIVCICIWLASFICSSLALWIMDQPISQSSRFYCVPQYESPLGATVTGLVLITINGLFGIIVLMSLYTLLYIFVHRVNNSKLVAQPPQPRTGHERIDMEQQQQQQQQQQQLQFDAASQNDYVSSLNGARSTKSKRGIHIQITRGTTPDSPMAPSLGGRSKKGFHFSGTFEGSDDDGMDRESPIALRLMNLERAVVRKSITITITFAMCWVPILIQHAVYLFTRKDVGPEWGAFAYLMLTMNGVVNPIILLITDARFRHSVRERIYNVFRWK